MSEMVAVMAYVNPGTGSLMLQFLLIGLAGALITFRGSWHWIKEFFTRKKSTKSLQEPDGR